jgi:poly-gamma-glutamate synthesis protein (capsule biosynthesis protein)
MIRLSFIGNVMIGRSFNQLFEKNDINDYYKEQKKEEIGYNSVPSDKYHRIVKNIKGDVKILSNWLSSGKIGPTFYDIFLNDNLYNIWGDTRDHLVKSDLTICNLKNCITHYPIKFPQKPNCYKLQPKYSKILKAGGIDYCNLANDHAMDYMGVGMLDTKHTLNELGIKHTGSGNNINEASEPAFFKRGNTTIGILSGSDHYRWWGAEKNVPGIKYIDLSQNNWGRLIKQIQDVKKRCEILVYVINWQDRNFDWFAKKLIDYGVDIVHGCLNHKKMPVVNYKKGIIIYSCGNFIDDYKVTNKNNLSYITDVYIDFDKINCVKIKSTKRENYQVNFI